MRQVCDSLAGIGGRIDTAPPQNVSNRQAMADPSYWLRAKLAAIERVAGALPDGETTRNSLAST